MTILNYVVAHKLGFGIGFGIMTGAVIGFESGMYYMKKLLKS